MIIIGGENLVDLIEQQTKDGSKIFQAKLGGSPYNCALTIGRQGADIGYLTPISTDSFGTDLVNNLADSNVKLLGERVKEPTSLALVSLETGNAKYQFYRENTADRTINLEGLQKATPKNSSAFYVGSLALTDGVDADIWANYLSEMKQRGLFIAIDPNIRVDFIKDRNNYLSRFNQIIKHTDLLKLSDEDLSWLVPNKSISDAAKSLIEKSSIKLLVVTLGAKGAFTLSANGPIISVKAGKVKTFIDNIGAGDVFMGSLLAYLYNHKLLSAKSLSNMSIEKITNMLEYSATAAALNCQKAGCNPPFAKEIII